jgi:hypothetical protein
MVVQSDRGIWAGKIRTKCWISLQCPAVSSRLVHKIYLSAIGRSPRFALLSNVLEVSEIGQTRNSFFNKVIQCRCTSLTSMMMVANRAHRIRWARTFRAWHRSLRKP